MRGNRLYAGGTFTPINGINRVGAGPPRRPQRRGRHRFDARLTAPELARTRVEHFAISPDGHRLVAVGAISHVAGHARAQIAMFDVAGPKASLYDWYTDAYEPQCDAGLRHVPAAGEVLPERHVLRRRRHRPSSSPTMLCDSAARFETLGTGRHNPTWVKRTGGDSLYAVAVTGAAVYVGGHQR